MNFRKFLIFFSYKMRRIQGLITIIFINRKKKLKIREKVCLSVNYYLSNKINVIIVTFIAFQFFCENISKILTFKRHKIEGFSKFLG
jgi:hypothetical protein